MPRYLLAGCSASALVAVIVVAGAAPPAGAVETDIAISTTAIDFGAVNVGSTASVSVTLTNTGGDPFGPINMFGGAPPTAEFNASQNCQATTLPAGGSCSVSYSFAPTSVGSFTDTSSFTVSETASQSDGEDFSVALAGTGVDPTATTTSSTEPTTTTSTTLETTTTSTTPTTPTSPPSTAGSSGTSPATSPATTAAATTTSSTVPTVLPLTGIAVVRPAIVVKVDNVDAEPQAGLGQADIVFEEIVEGGATRFAAVFNSTEPGVVGPVRSARNQDVDLLLALGDPALVYSGANAGVDAALEGAGFELFAEGAAGFFRRDDLVAPHNLFVDLAQIRPQVVSSGDAVPVFEYSPPGAPVAVVGATPVTFAELAVGGYDVRWDWDPNRGVFLRSQLGHPHQLTDGQASATNVVVLTVEYGTNADGGPEANTVGTGPAVVYRAGQRTEGTWSRASATEPFTLRDATGQPMLLAPGRTWVELADGTSGLTDG